MNKEIIRIIAYGVGLSSIAAVVYLAGPMIEIGGVRPLENSIVRDIIIVVLVAAAAGLAGFTFWRRKKNAAEIEKGIAEGGAPDSDAEVLGERMKDALATLKNASKGATKGAYLYELPWYLLIGPPGAGKTTALANSGLKFPLSRGATPAAVAGVGGTRYCDWWFTEDAVMIDTAGRYTTQDSDARADQKSWLAFLDLLKKNRPRQPINGVIVAIALSDIMTETQAQIEAHAQAIRSRLIEVNKQLKVDFPVYVLFTKADLISGFREFFGSLNENARAQVWGATFQTADKKLNLVGEVPAEYDSLIARLNEWTTDRLQEEPVPSTRASLFGFPAQVAALKKPVFNFLNLIFEPTRYHANATLRGFYFTSGTQEGTPIDQLIGALSRSFGAREVAANAYSGRGQSYFLKNLVGKLIIGEAAWVSTDRAAVFRARLIKGVALGLLALVCAGLSLAWFGSYQRNSDLIVRTQAGAADFRTVAGPLATEPEISDRDLAKILPPLNKLRFLPAGFETKGETPPLAATFGLSQFDRLQSASTGAYDMALERLLRPRLIYRLEEQMEANRGDPSFLYEALKVYLMLGGLHAVDRDLVMNYLRRDWTENLYPGSANADGRRLLEAHVAAMLDMKGDIIVSLNGPLVSEAQNLLARLSVSQQAYELLRSQAASSEISDWNAARQGGPDSALVFEATQGAALDSIKVPAFYTYAGFRRLFIDRLSGIGEKLKSDRWVLGAAGEQAAVEDQYKSLSDDLLAIYGKDFIAAWQSALGRLKLKRLLADKPKYVTLAAASAPTSPIKQLIVSVRDETALTRERPGFAKKEGVDPNAALFQNRAVPGADIEQAFKAYHVLVEGEAGRAPVDLIISNLAEIYQSLLLMGNPAQAPLATSQLQTQVAALRANANRLPQPFAGMLQTAGTDIDGDLTNSFRSQLNRALRDTVTGVCQQVVSNRYPFARTDREVSLVDFGRLFGPQGIIDKFFSTQIQQYVDMSKPVWTFRQDNNVARALASSGATLKEFQRAAQIRDVFFATGGLMPSMTLTITPPPAPLPALPAPPPPAAGAAQAAPAATPAPAAPTVSIKMDMNGTPIISPAGASAPVVAQWPGASTNRSAITVTSDAPGAQPSTIERRGPWSLFRLIEAGAPVPHGDSIVVSYIVGGRELQYTFSAGSTQNPFTLPALREFHCPSDL
ncbi:type VI secretion protein IcmF [Methylocella silvestris BL2]|uniref:Type VI secretion protein IcmF n=1 Tax=Methylocella silvestris (strain DSM 15510 / CIP 108128 / LMG 27833 / NCIMB 13906 / BL2) TaxID=395965 RepID=B8EIG3_METSB|nr:type VI secretion system membrane subunit TssM [Methylocella silvestris]ACK51282.1 type VI secretion protein IcmF [Methylocella silvestris BL2]